MKTKFVWLIVSLLLVAALVLASCGPGEKVVKKGELYGGTLTVFERTGQSEDPPSPDIADGAWFPLMWLEPIQESPLIGDFEKYGPRGTDEFSFQLQAYIPDEFLVGNLLESWEMTPTKLVWNVRPGIMWHDKEGVMKSRELTAEDVAADLRYFKAAPGGKGFSGIAGDITATDKYTVVIELQKIDLLLNYIIGYEDRALFSPPETEGSSKWADQTGTGPFMLKEYVIGSHMSYDRNPNWRKTTTIDGVEYQLPFIDELVMPIIPDTATQMAALRTAKIDYFLRVPPEHFTNIEATASGIRNVKFPEGNTMDVVLKCTEPPTDDVDVRRALMVGTDMEAFAALQGVGELPKHTYPFWPGHPESIYTPMEKLPESTQMLFDYDPVKAKQMLADAGYPNGFTIDHWIDPTTEDQDQGALLKSQWAKIGVEVNLITTEAVTHREHLHAGTYTGTMNSGVDVGNPLNALLRHFKTGSIFNYFLWSDSYFDEQMDKLAQELDYTKRNAILKEMGVYVIDKVPIVPTAIRTGSAYWWPWLKNYYGETNIGDNDFHTIMAYLWIDQDLKKDMGH